MKAARDYLVLTLKRGFSRNKKMALQAFMCSKDQVGICKTVMIKCIFCIKPNRFLMIVANTKNTKKRKTF